MNLVASGKKTLDGKDLFTINFAGKEILTYEENGALVEYDEKLLHISYSQETDEGVQRIEISKKMFPISNDRLLGFHTYKYPDKDQVYNVIVVWTRKRGDWGMTIKKGVSDLNTEDLMVLKKGIAEMNW